MSGTAIKAHLNLLPVRGIQIAVEALKTLSLVITRLNVEIKTRISKSCLRTVLPTFSVQSRFGCIRPVKKAFPNLYRVRTCYCFGAQSTCGADNNGYGRGCLLPASLLKMTNLSVGVCHHVYRADDCTVFITATDTCINVSTTFASSAGDASDNSSGRFGTATPPLVGGKAYPVSSTVGNNKIIRRKVAFPRIACFIIVELTSISSGTVASVSHSC
ncbi:unnamed protein product [Protopolystoma xenopodis]|uniref:Uncharacterized protein n=1 Tax=Protopolystoma xenopodis TaxID=117903 RepID=A0A3S5C3I2_9PLAT|nr:unnamed protein product [Protopolystoma xenopodis]